jgi:hypothetical protein
MEKMTEVIWNAGELASDFPDLKTLGELIDRASAVARQRGQFVCSIKVNGLNLSEDQEAKFGQTPLAEVNDFSIKIQDLDLLLDESTNQCVTFLNHLIKSLEVASHMFRAEDLAAAHRFYRTCIEGTQLFIEMLTHYKVAAQNSKKVDLGGWSKLELSLQRALMQILEAYRQKNYILVADLLEYELSPVFIQWQGALGHGHGVQQP